MHDRRGVRAEALREGEDTKDITLDQLYDDLLNTAKIISLEKVIISRRHFYSKSQILHESPWEGDKALLHDTNVPGIPTNKIMVSKRSHQIYIPLTFEIYCEGAVRF